MVFPRPSERRFRSLYKTRLGTLTRNVDSQASSHEIGIESNHASHCASEIPSRCRLVKAAGQIRSAATRPFLFIWRRASGFAQLSLAR